MMNFEFIRTNCLFHLCAHLGFAQRFSLFTRTNLLFQLRARFGFAERHFAISFFGSSGNTAMTSIPVSR